MLTIRNFIKNMFKWLIYSLKIGYMIKNTQEKDVTNK